MVVQDGGGRRRRIDGEGWGEEEAGSNKKFAALFF